MYENLRGSQFFFTTRQTGAEVVDYKCASKLNFRASKRENYDAIPEITTEITNNKEKKDTNVSKESHAIIVLLLHA